MLRSTTTRMLLGLARHFHDEGDLDTAYALRNRVKAHVCIELSAEDGDRLAPEIDQARSFDFDGHYRDAARHYAVATEIARRVLGTGHRIFLERLSDQARCRLNGGHYRAAEADFALLARLVDDSEDEADSMADMAREFGVRCRDFARQHAASARLQPYVHALAWQAAVARQVESCDQRARLRAATVASVRRRGPLTAAALHKQLLRLASARPDNFACEQGLAFVSELRQAGESDLALASLSILISSLNVSEPDTGRVSLLTAALREQALCHTARGCHRSAQAAGRRVEELERVHAVCPASSTSAPDLT